MICQHFYFIICYKLLTISFIDASYTLELRIIISLSSVIYYREFILIYRLKSLSKVYFIDQLQKLIIINAYLLFLVYCTNIFKSLSRIYYCTNIVYYKIFFDFEHYCNTRNLYLLILFFRLNNKKTSLFAIQNNC